MSNSNESASEISIKCNCLICLGKYAEVTREDILLAVMMYKSMNNMWLDSKERLKPYNFYSTVINLLLHG